MRGVANILSIAGSDPSGGAGVQADLKTFAAHGAYGMAAITALTAQNTQGVAAVHIPPVEFLAAQLQSVFEDVRVDAVKIGMLASAALVGVVATALARYGARKIVLDPVLVATSGDSLGAPDVVDAMRAQLFARAALITPNGPEAARLTDLPEPKSLDDMRACARKLMQAGAPAVLVKGGHGEGAEAIDLLLSPVGEAILTAPRIATRNTHGTGCTLSSAIAARLGQGADLETAVRGAKAYVTNAIRAADGLNVGKGHGPLDHAFGQRG
jgi:hydroxymethylpyrimidine kinase/phosphomethylpyrimidine kinase